MRGVKMEEEKFKRKIRDNLIRSVLKGRRTATTKSALALTYIFTVRSSFRDS